MDPKVIFSPHTQAQIKWNILSSMSQFDTYFFGLKLNHRTLFQSKILLNMTLRRRK